MKSAEVSSPSFSPPPEKVKQVTQILSALANEQRLKALCLLSENGEMSVGALLEHMELSQSALSQHLSKLRGEGFVETRKEGLNVYYRVEREDIRALLNLFYKLYC